MAIVSYTNLYTTSFYLFVYRQHLLMTWLIHLTLLPLLLPIMRKLKQSFPQILMTSLVIIY